MLPKLILFGEIWAAAICFFVIAYLSYCFFAGDIGKKNKLGGTCLALSFFCLPCVLLAINSQITEAAAIVIICGVLSGIAAFAYQERRAKLFLLGSALRFLYLPLRLQACCIKQLKLFAFFLEAMTGSANLPA